MPLSDLIFSDASELRHIANKKAHKLPAPKTVNDVEQLIDDACPEDEKRITRVCFFALDQFQTSAHTRHHAEPAER